MKLNIIETCVDIELYVCRTSDQKLREPTVPSEPNCKALIYCLNTGILKDFISEESVLYEVPLTPYIPLEIFQRLSNTYTT